MFRLQSLESVDTDLGGDSVARGAPMLIKELPPAWPPVVSEPKNTVRPELGDVVVSVQNKGNGKLAVRLRKRGKYAPEYAITLIIPENVLQRTLFAIMAKRGMTLGEVGELTVQ